MGGERAPSYLTSLSLSAAVQTVTGDVTPFYCLTTCRVDTWFPEQSELEIRIVLARWFFFFFYERNRRLFLHVLVYGKEKTASLLRIS